MTGLSKLGVEAIFLIMVLQIVLNFVINLIKSKKNKSENKPLEYQSINKKIEKLFNYHDECPIKIIQEKAKENEKKIEALQANHTNISNQILKIFEQLSAVNTKLDILLEEKKKK